MKANVKLMTGTEAILGLGGRTVGDFWRWAYSDVLSNRNRSIFAEYLVGVALGVVDRPRVEWDSADLRYGDLRVEVKSSAYVQSWGQDRPSRISFGIKKAVEWDASTGKYEGTARRCSDLYVFCLYGERDKSKVNVLDVAGWEFHVVSTKRIDEEFGEAKTLSLASVRRVGVRCGFDELKAAVDGVVS